MPFGEQTTAIGHMVEKKSHQLRGGWQGGALISELIDIGEVSTGGGKFSHSTRPLGRWRGKAPKHSWKPWSLGESDIDHKGSWRHDLHRGEVVHVG